MRKRKRPDKDPLDFNPEATAWDDLENSGADADETPVFEWTDEQIKKHWLDLRNTAESLTWGNAPVIYGMSDHSFFLYNYDHMVESLALWYQENRKPDPELLEKASQKAGVLRDDLEARYLKASGDQYRIEIRNEIRKQMLQKMSEALSEFFSEINDQVLRTLRGETVLPGFDFRHQYTAEDRKRLPKVLNKIQKDAKLRRNAPRKGREPKHKWTSQELPKFPQNYNSVKKTWRAAFKFYSSNYCQDENESKCLQLVSIKYQGLPDNLVHRIPGAYAPSELALQHAAQLCGIPPNLYTSRQLRKYLRTAKQTHQTPVRN